MPETEKKLEKPTLKIEDLFADADNNIWDWVGMHAPGAEAMADLLSRRLEVSVEEIRASMGRVYGMAGCMEFKELVQFMDVVLDKVVAKSIEKSDNPLEGAIQGAVELLGLVQAAHKKYTAVREENFKLYPGIEELFKVLHANRVKIHIVTDAPIHKAISRIKQKGLEPYITTLFAQPRFKLQSHLHFNGNGLDEKYAHIHKALAKVVDNLSEHYEPELHNMGHYEVPFKVKELNDQRKPNIELADLIGSTREKIGRTAAVWGDSVNSDMALAANNDCAAFFSAYGKVRPEHSKILDLYGNPKGPSRDIDSEDPKTAAIREKLGERLIRLDAPIEMLKHLGFYRHIIKV